MTLALKISLLVTLSIGSGVLYHLGGIGKPYPTKLRDLGCSFCLVACLWLFKGFSWAYLLVLGLSWAFLSSYWKGKAVDMKWWNWALHGLFCGLAALPLIWADISPYSILYRSIFCSLAMMAVSEVSEDVRYEEWGRGFIFCTSVIFLI